MKQAIQKIKLFTYYFMKYMLKKSLVLTDIKNSEAEKHCKKKQKDLSIKKITNC